MLQLPTADSLELVLQCHCRFAQHRSHQSLHQPQKPSPSRQSCRRTAWLCRHEATGIAFKCHGCLEYIQCPQVLTHVASFAISSGTSYQIMNMSSIVSSFIAESCSEYDRIQQEHFRNPDRLDVRSFRHVPFPIEAWQNVSVMSWQSIVSCTKTVQIAFKDARCSSKMVSWLQPWRVSACHHSWWIVDSLRRQRTALSR